MNTEMSKSISFMLYERLSSPFYGSLLASWLIWNWKIPYLTFFVSESKIEGNKLDYIVTNLSNINTLVTWPVISTAVILTIIPFVSNGAFWLNIKFNKWKHDQKNHVEMNTLLTLEQSILLREEVLKSEERLEGLLEKKNQEIKDLNNRLKEISGVEIAPAEVEADAEEDETDTVRMIADKIVNNDDLRVSFEEAVRFIQGGYANLIGSEKVSPKSIAYFEANHLIVNSGKGMYSLTDLGRAVLKCLLDESF